MLIKSINKIKVWYRVTIFQDDWVTKQIILECDNLEWLIDKIRIFMIEYRESRMEKIAMEFWDIEKWYDEIQKTLRGLDF